MDEDKLLLNLIASDNQCAFKYLFFKYVKSLKLFISYHIHDLEKSEEYVLDIFTSLYTNRKKLNIHTSLKAYLFKAARYKIASYFRTKKNNDLHIENIKEPCTMGYINLEYQELSQLVEQAMSLLPERCRYIFFKSRFENMKNKEIAAEMNISEKTVENQITIALKRIRKFLDHNY